MTMDGDNSQPQAIADVLIVGGGSAGWMAATMLATALGPKTKVTLVESSAIGTVGVGEATIPPIKKFNRFCGIDERAFLAATNGTMKIGIEFENWGGRGEKYLHAFGNVGRELDGLVRLHHWWRMGQSAGLADYPAWEDLYLARPAANAMRFGLPGQPTGNPGDRLVHAYHFDAQLYAQFLRKISEQRGVAHVEGKIASVGRDGESGHVTHVVLDDGRELAADFFVDCTGFRSLLLGEAMEEPFEDWSRWLASDRALAVPSAPDERGIIPITRSIAHNVGWQWRIPLQNRIGNGHVYSSAFSTDEAAEERLLSGLDTPARDTPRLICFTTGRRKNAWSGNVVAIGLSAGFLEPLESTSLHLVQTGLERLVDFFPSRRIEPALRDRYNVLVEQEWTQIRDFIIAHYKVNQRGDSEFWRHCASMDVPDTLTELLELWEHQGRLTIDGGHLFQLGSWSQVLIGQNLLPKAVHSLTNRTSAEAAARDIRQIAASLRARAEGLPLHKDFLESYCAGF
ncbi:tryptophan halogenase family protein [Qipengyuania vesicularis]|uniref:tryptophan halogenase family protein n=1 Tax=Qipengyuania vesicularis TaxID=2867232 RepID=UPI001C87E631|nr:tryptophan halogenase family protein [Qipengyuania vesicularis]MBX7528535.1 tryptophan 7-halogenase [Qipengyuania vesicularis]